ncbi:MAG TPA: hypothetical protein VF075_05570, partial [Pyrinomonadaceae bacterium]
MKNRRVHLLLTVVVLGGVATFVSFAALTSRGQSSRSASNTPKRTAPSRADKSDSVPAVFTEAAMQNVVLRQEVTWTFGGKQQRGWYLYDLLIGKTLDTQHETVTNAFAAELAHWQKKKGLRADGFLNEDSL